MDTLDRFRGALVGLAVGEAFGGGADAEPHGSAAVRSGGTTSQALAAARAMTLLLEDDADVEAIASATTEAFVEWRRDRLAWAREPDLATTLAVDRLIEGMPWREAGDPRSRAPVAAARAVAIGLPFAPERVQLPARISTAVTHHDPTALEASVFVAWMTSQLARGATLSRGLVAAGRAMVLDMGIGGGVPDALADALSLYDRLGGRAAPWLPVDAIGGGDGGRCAESAVALGALAALLAQPGDDAFAAGLELVARFRIDTVDVGAIAGAFLGAANGLTRIPGELAERLDRYDALTRAAEVLYAGAIDLPTERATPAPVPRRAYAPTSPDAANTALPWGAFVARARRVGAPSHMAVASQWPSYFFAQKR
jgi:ADP-ribosyl-[dinitrogen reductase] hydrolase